MIGTIETWFEPCRYTKFGRDGHKSCWDCKNVRSNNSVGMGRRCAAYPGRSIPDGQVTNLSLEPDGVTVADGCDKYEESEQTKAYDFLGYPSDARFHEAEEDRRLTAAFR